MIRALSLIVALALAPPASAYHLGETFLVKLRTASVHGSYSKRACSVQANMRSEKKQPVSFAIYWQPGKGLWLLTTHKGYQRASGKQDIEFLFPSGTGLRFPMTQKKSQVQANIGFGNSAQVLNKHLKANKRMTINLVGIGDRVAVNLSEQAKIVAAMKKCREFLH